MKEERIEAYKRVGETICLGKQILDIGEIVFSVNKWQIRSREALVGKQSLGQIMQSNKLTKKIYIENLDLSGQISSIKQTLK
jgi:hypothetical protein